MFNFLPDVRVYNTNNRESECERMSGACSVSASLGGYVFLFWRGLAREKDLERRWCLSILSIQPVLLAALFGSS